MFNARTVVLAVVALLIAGVTALFVRAWLQAEGPQPAVEARPTAVLVAKMDLPAGSFIKEADLRWQSWPNETVDPNYLLEGKDELAGLKGAVVRRGIAAGEPITASRIAKPGDRGFLAAVLKPGMRAMSIGISEVSGISGLVFPGDRVDIILTHAVPGGADGMPLRASETVLENVRVLALDQKLSDQKGEPKLASTATIEVTPKQVEMISVVLELGRLSLSLRSLANEADEQLIATSVAEEELLRELAGEEPDGANGAPAASPPKAVADVDEIAEPERGVTYTLDNEVSRLISGPKNGNRKILVVHGSTAVEITVD